MFHQLGKPRTLSRVRYGHVGAGRREPARFALEESRKNVRQEVAERRHADEHPDLATRDRVAKVGRNANTRAPMRRNAMAALATAMAGAPCAARGVKRPFRVRLASMQIRSPRRPLRRRLGERRLGDDTTRRSAMGLRRCAPRLAGFRFFERGLRCFTPTTSYCVGAFQGTIAVKVGTAPEHLVARRSPERSRMTSRRLSLRRLHELSLAVPLRHEEKLPLFTETVATVVIV